MKPSVKRCPRCDQDKPISEFPPRKDRPSGVMSRCRECDNAKSKAYYQANVDAKRAYYVANRKKKADYYHEIRARAVEIYGGRCEKCGITDWLEFDHVNGDGGLHRKVESHKAMYLRIVTAGRPIEDYKIRLLCYACHRPESAGYVDSSIDRILWWVDRGFKLSIEQQDRLRIML